MVFKSLKPMWFMMIFLFIINLFVYKGGPQIIPEWWIFDIHLEAITQTLKIVIRLLLLITLIMNTYAWFIYISKVSVDMEVHIVLQNSKIQLKNYVI